MRSALHLSPFLALLMLAACDRPAAPPAEAAADDAVRTAEVQAVGETEPVGTADDDAADDPAIWRNPADPARSLIVGTDKKAGLYVYGLDGKVRHFLDAGRVNNVDLAEWGGRVIVAASDRTDKANAHVALFTLDTATAKLSPLARIPAGEGEAYGLCLYSRAEALHAFLVLKDGTIRQIALEMGAAPTGRSVRTLKLETQSEGCVVDARTGRLYVGEEDVGVWRFDARPDGPVDAVSVARVDGARLIADVEGVALASEGDSDGGYLIVSSQGDNAYALLRLSDDSFVGRFRITAGRFGGTSETDGIEVSTASFGPGFPEGLMVVQDGDNAPAAQNFKLVSWKDVKAALGL
jgi:3-phytase